jgi:fluoride ion exporter CrcB/FEX
MTPASHHESRPLPLEKINLIGTGGFIGAVLRYLVGSAAQAWSKAEIFPPAH